MEPYYPSVGELLAKQRIRDRLLWAGLILVTLLVFGTIGFVLYMAPRLSAETAWAAGMALFVLFVTPVIIWNRPALGVYLLTAAAVVFGAIPGTDQVKVTIPTSYIPFWTNISTIGYNYGTRALQALVFSPAEVIMVFATATWVIRAVAARDLRVITGPLFPWVAAYMAMVAVGFVRGLNSGGDMTMALWEVRPQSHFALAYLLGASVFRTREEVVPVVGIIAGAAGLQGLFGALTYFSKGGVVEVGGIMPHEDSLLLNLLFFIFFIAWITRHSPRLTWCALFLVPGAVLSVLANQRRAGIGAFIVAFVPLVPLLWLLFPSRRATVVRFVVVFALVSAIYFPLAWNARGPWALPARSLRSMSTPDERDASSDYYRLAEDLNLKYTRDLQPWLGIGYGRPYATVVEMPGFSQFTELMHYLPHNSLLWVWMRVGHLGFTVFLLMVAAVLVRGVHLLKGTRDPALRAAGLLAIVMLLMIMVYARYDLVLAQSRVMFMAGLLAGILGALPVIEGGAGGPPPDAVATTASRSRRAQAPGRKSWRW